MKKYAYRIVTPEGTLLLFADDGNDLMKSLLVVERCEENFRIADIERIERIAVNTEQAAEEEGELELVNRLIEQVSEEISRLSKRFAH